MEISVSMLVQSHLSDAMLNPNQDERNIHISFSKYLIHYFGLGEKVDPNEVFLNFCENFKLNLVN